MNQPVFALVGSIDFEMPMNEELWEYFIRRHDFLRPIKRMKFVNPFTKETESVVMANGMAAIVDGAAMVGVVSWTPLSGNGINVYSVVDAKTVRSIIKPLVRQLDGRFTSLSEL